MTAAPLVSILIPCHNAEPWLAATLESALAQTWENKEILLVNDGSTDGSLALAQSFRSRGVTVIDQPNAGQSAAFNTGIRAARGSFLEFLDADDLLAPEKIARQMARLQQLPPDWLATGCWGRFVRNPGEAIFEHGPVSRDLDPVQWILSLWSVHSMMHGAAWLVPAGLVARAGGWNEQLSLINDFEFFSRLVLASPGVAYCPEARSYYRSGLEGSLSGSRSPKAWKSAFESTRIGTERLLARVDDARAREVCGIVWRQLYWDSYPDAPADLRRMASRRAREFGLRLGRPPGGPWFTLASRILGWKLARRLQVARKRRARRLNT
jgi:glycosyltransferase involved in cell wall biosynthesis